MSAPDYNVLAAAPVREYLMLNAVPSASRYSDATIGSNVRAAAAHLERLTSRFFVDRPQATFQFTSSGRAQFLIPGVRNPATVAVTYQGAAMTVAQPPSNTGSCWLLPDVQQSGVYTGLVVRALVAQDLNRGWYRANPEWFDRGLDNPFFPGNYAGGYGYNSLPLDVAITADWGYAPADLPEPFLMSTKQLAAWLTVEPNAVLASVGETPSGRVVLYGNYPPYVQDFIAHWQLGEQAVSVG